MTEDNLSPGEIQALKQIAATELKERFRHCDAMVISARAGIGTYRDRPATKADIAELEDRRQLARKACIEAGLDVETMAESLARDQAADKARLTPLALVAAQTPPVISGRARERLSAGAGIVMFALCVMMPLVFTGEVTGLEILGGLFAGGVVWAAVQHALWNLFPTPVQRIATQAVEAGVDLRDCFPPGSPAREEYEFATRFVFHRMRRDGELIRIS